MTKENQDFWWQTTWQLPKEKSEDWMATLIQSGSLGCFENLKIDANEEKNRTVSDVLAYFPDQNEGDLQKKLDLLPKSEFIKLANLEKIPQADWATAWKEHFKPFLLAENIVICPSWEEYSPKANEHVIILDPGMAFGTGQHDTTRFCAELICEIKNQNPEAQSLLDIGCGSGILSIIAKKIGFQKVTGIDIEAPAIETAYENLNRNPNSAPIRFETTNGSLDYDFLEPSDVVVSNIIAEALCDLSQDLITLTKPEGFLILSGILTERLPLVEKAFDSLELITLRQSTSWCAALYRKGKTK